MTLALIMCLARPASGAILRVPLDYPTIAQAADVALSGDTIEVSGGGSYPDEIVNLRSGVTLRGLWNPDWLSYPHVYDGTIYALDGPDTTRIETFVIGVARFGIGIESYSSRLVVSNCEFGGGGPWGYGDVRLWEGGAIRFCSFYGFSGEVTGVQLRQGTVDIAYCRFDVILATDVVNENAPQPADVRFRNNTLYTAACSFRMRSGSALDVTNNIFEHNSVVESCIGGQAGNIRYNDFHDNAGSYCGYGVGNIFVDPVLCGGPPVPRHLHPTSPCIGSGENGTNMGAFPVGCEVTSVSEREGGGAPAFDLAVTSPFERTTTFTLGLAAAAEVRLRIFDPTGRLVSELAGGRYEPGLRRWEWDASDHPAGVYLYEIAVGPEVRAGRIVRIR